MYVENLKPNKSWLKMVNMWLVELMHNKNFHNDEPNEIHWGVINKDKLVFWILDMDPFWNPWTDEQMKVFSDEMNRHKIRDEDRLTIADYMMTGD